MTESCVKVMRELLDAAYNASGISTLAFDLYSSVHANFSPGMTKDQMIRMIVDYAERHGKKDVLIAYVREEVPYQYERFRERLETCYHDDRQFVNEPPELTTKTGGSLSAAHDNLSPYNDADQPWYVSNFPKLAEIDSARAQALSSQIDVVIMTATDVELKSVISLLQPYPYRKTVLLNYWGAETYYLGKFGSWKTAVTKCRMGAGGAGGSTLATESAIRNWQPRAIVMVGIAFGKDAAKQKIGDMLVASQIIPYEKQRVGVEVIFRDPIPPTNSTLLNRFENALDWQFYRPDGKLCAIRYGPLLSGEKLVDDAQFKANLFNWFPQAIGGEMEGAGVAAAAGQNGIAWILVKGICDWGDGEKHDNYQPLAAAAATSLVYHVLSKQDVLKSIKKG